MSAFPKADVQDVRIGIDLNVRLWRKQTLVTVKMQFVAYQGDKN